MTEFHPSMPSMAPALADSAVDPKFYVVSKWKFTVLFVATLGIYNIYWFYKNWDRYKDQTPYAPEAADTIWPFMRAIFAIFFVPALFRRIKEYGNDKMQIRAWSHTSHGILMILLLIAYGILDRLSGHSIGSPWTDLLSLLILAPMTAVFRAAQEIINVACNDPDGKSNSKLTWANYFWIILGVVFWLIILFGMVLPDPG